MNPANSDLAEMISAIPGTQITPDGPMASHTSMGVGGRAKLVASIDGSRALVQMLDILNRENAQWMMLGGGANTLFLDEGYDGVVIIPGMGLRSIELTGRNNNVRAEAGTQLSALMNFCKREGLSGMEWAAGIPGTVGGALAGNAGTPAGDICSLAREVEVVPPGGQMKTRSKGEFGFGYRWSSLKSDVIVATVLELEPEDPAVVQERIAQALIKRREQPIGERSLGCMFKNPNNEYAGRLIDKAGLKGLREGGAMVSKEHANFIINEGSATSCQIIGLMDRIQEIIHKDTGILLEREIRVIGRKGELSSSLPADRQPPGPS